MAVSIRDVAREAGVSVGTVSNVLNRPGIVAPATADRVSLAIEKLGFVRNDVARQLRVGRSRSIGLVVLDGRNPFFADLAAGAQRAALSHGYTVLTGSSDDRPEQEAELLSLFQEQRVTGI
ncbi:MAG: LacI family DNA-binding transcriptional regulator, partial [Leucobacter sp.]